MLGRLGAELVLFESGASYQAGIDLTCDMAARDPHIFLPRQFENPLNADDHEHTTGQEIIAQAGGPVDAFVSGFGTGGTIAGVGRALKARWPAVQIIAMEPSGEATPGEFPCCHRIEGVAQNFEPPLLRRAPIDRRLAVSGSDAMLMARRLHREAVAEQDRLGREAEAEARSSVASYAVDKAAYYTGQLVGDKWYVAAVNALVGLLLGLVDVVRGFTRPALTLYTIGLTTYMFIWIQNIVAKMGLEQFTPTEIKNLTMQIVGAVLYLTTVSFVWWFGTRPPKQGNDK